MGKHKPRKTKISDNCRNVSAGERQRAMKTGLNRKLRPAKMDDGTLIKA